MKIFFSVFIVIILSISTFIAIPLATNDKLNKINIQDNSLSQLNFEEVKFNNLIDSTKLSGILFIPENDLPKNYAILIADIGDYKRTDVWYLALTKILLENNIAVLIPDKRGCENSEGTWKGLSLEALADDTEAALKFLVVTKKIAQRNIGLIGLGQGGLIAPIVGAKNSNLNFIVNISGSMLPYRTELEVATKKIAESHTYKWLANNLFKYRWKRKQTNPNYIPIFDFNPMEYWVSVYSPALIVLGQNDIYCQTDLCIQQLMRNKLDHFNIEVFKNGEHYMLNDERTAFSERFQKKLIDFIMKSSN